MLTDREARTKTGTSPSPPRQAHPAAPFADVCFEDLPTDGTGALAPERMRSTLGRFFLYSLGLGALFAAVFESVPYFGLTSFVRESGLLEQAQLVILLASAVTLAIFSRRQSRELLLVAAALPVLGITRELDAFFDDLLYHGSWTIPFYAVLTATVFYGVRRRRQLVEQFPIFAKTRAFGIFFVGFLIVVLVSRVMGRQAVWRAAMGEEYVRTIPRLVEETVELAGYMIFLLGAIELRFCLPRSSRRREWTAHAVAAPQD